MRLVDDDSVYMTKKMSKYFCNQIFIRKFAGSKIVNKVNHTRYETIRIKEDCYADGICADV